MKNEREWEECWVGGEHFIVAGDDNATVAANVYTCDTAEGR